MLNKTTITVESYVKNNFDTLKKKHHYSSSQELLTDMQAFFLDNNINPRYHHDIVNKTVTSVVKNSLKESDTSLRKFIGHQFKEVKQLMGSEGSGNSLKNIEQQITTLAHWLIEKLDAPKPLPEIKTPPMEHTTKKDTGKVQSDETDKSVKRIKESILYLVDELKHKMVKKDNELILSPHHFSEFEQGLTNVLNK